MRILLALVVLLLAGCSLPPADPERVAQAHQFYGFIRDGDVASAAAQSTVTLRPQLTEDFLVNARPYVVGGEPRASKVISYQSNRVAGGPDSYQVNQALEYPQITVLVSVLMVREPGGQWLVDGFHLNTLNPAQAEAATSFSLQGKSPIHYGVLAAVVLAPLICLASAGVAAWRRRWGWMALCLFGIGQLSLNWASGEWQFQPLHFSLLSAGFFKGMGPFDPWILMVSLPLPAILFWALGRHRTMASKAGATAGQPPAGAA